MHGLKNAVIIIINASGRRVESTFGKTSFSVSQEHPGDTGEMGGGGRGNLHFLQKFEKGFNNFFYLKHIRSDFLKRGKRISGGFNNSLYFMHIYLLMFYKGYFSLSLRNVIINLLLILKEVLISCFRHKDFAQYCN